MNKIIYSDVISNGILGNIYVYWGDDGRLTEVRLTPSPLDILAVNADFSATFPTVYRYLKDFGEASKLNFSYNIFNLDYCTPFMHDVYRALFETSRGETVSYGELAALAGYPGAARAVGSAMRKNRFLILIPCHRVTAANGIGGYSGAGIEIKKQLLQAEGVEIR